MCQYGIFTKIGPIVFAVAKKMTVIYMKGTNKMAIVFLILYILSSSMVYSIASDQRMGFNPYPFGATIFCMLLHIPILVSCIFYLGWLWGIICFLIHLLGLVHATVGWIFSIPVLVASDEDQLLRFLKFKLSLLAPTLLINTIFAVISFFVADFQALLNLFNSNSTFVIMFVIIVAVLSLLRIVVSKLVSNDS